MSTSALTSGLNGFRSKPRDDRDERIRELELKIAQITIDNELLYASLSETLNCKILKINLIDKIERDLNN